MNGFFRFDETLVPFAFYSSSHWIALTVIALTCAAALLFRNRWNPRIADRFRFSLAFFLLLLDIALYAWYISSGRWDAASSLPLHLCSLTLITAIVMLWTRSYRLFEFVYFAGIGGALQALLTPAAILSDFPHFTYYYFFIAHGGIIVSCLLMISAYGFRPRLASIGRTMLYLNALLVPIFFVNRLTGGNYFFIARKPAGASLLEYLGPWPYYIASMELVALAVFFLLYAPFYRKKNPRA